MRVGPVILPVQNTSTNLYLTFRASVEWCCPGMSRRAMTVVISGGRIAMGPRQKNRSYIIYQPAVLSNLAA